MLPSKPVAPPTKRSSRPSPLISATDREGPWRNRRKHQTFSEAIRSAFSAALIHFLRDLEGRSTLPEFRDYMLEKYPEIDDDLVTMMDDFIKSEKEKVAYSILEANEHGLSFPDLLKSVGNPGKGGDIHSRNAHLLSGKDTGFKLPELVALDEDDHG